VKTDHFLRKFGRLLPLVGILLVVSCSQPSSVYRVEVAGPYREYCGTKKGLEVWIVDGMKVRRDIFPQFLYGGNNQRYPFIARNEIWIDNAISAEEFNYTLQHEIRERDLMAKNGLTYEAAHDSALFLEHRLRLDDQRSAHDHERRLGFVSPTDFYGEKEVAELPDSLPLHGIYRVYVGQRDSLEIWIVDGAAIRRDIYPDFGLSGNDLAYHFIPSKEIWIDAQVSCEETEFSIQTEIHERNAIQNGLEYDPAYERAIDLTLVERKAVYEKAAGKPPIKLTAPLTRDKGTGDERK
jgi:hypothetical protein